MNAVGERNAGKLLVAFDEGLLGNASDLLYLDVEGSGVIQTFTLRRTKRLWNWFHFSLILPLITIDNRQSLPNGDVIGAGVAIVYSLHECRQERNKMLSCGIDTHLKMHQVEIQNQDEKVDLTPLVLDTNSLIV